MPLLATSGAFGTSVSSDQLIVVNLAAILVGITFNAPQKIIDFVKEHNQSDITLYNTISSS